MDSPVGALGSLLWIAVLAKQSATQPTEVRALSADPDFRQVSLNWLYPRRASDLFAFRVDYCELQAWGVNRCRTKMVDAPPRPSVGGGQGVGGLVDEDLSEYGVVVTGLRMATNYTFSVSPVEGRLQQLPAYLRNRHARTIMAPTKGFSARATLCLPDVSEVEVHTGPHFSGRIAVEHQAHPADQGNSVADPSAWGRSETDLVERGRGERGVRVHGEPDQPGGPGGGGEPCAVAGDPSSPRESYTLRIDHRRCGSHVNRSTVATFILVQENLPILTHSTRRFLVLCTFQPDALIVRAGISLPTVHGEHRNREDLAERAQGNQLGGGPGVAAGVGPAEVMAFQLQDEEDAALGALGMALGRQQRRHVSQAMTQDTPRSSSEEGEAQLVLTSVLLVSGVVGCAITAWWFAPRRKSSRSSMASLTDDSASSVSAYQNYENSLRDSDSYSSLDSSRFGTVNSSVLSAASGRQWNYGLHFGPPYITPFSATKDADLVEGDEFGAILDPKGGPKVAEESDLVFAIRLPDASSACSVSLGEEPTSLSHSDA